MILGTIVLTAAVLANQYNFVPKCHASCSKNGRCISVLARMIVSPAYLSGLKYQHHDSSVVTLVHKVCGLSFSAVFELALKQASSRCLPGNRGDQGSPASCLVPTKKKEEVSLYFVHLI